MRPTLPLLLAGLCAPAIPTLAQAQAPAAPVVAASADPTAMLMTLTAKVPGVVTLPSGLKYKVTRSGPATGAHPQPGDAIKVNYEGRLASGAVFDSTYKRNKPALLMLADLVPAWMEAIPLMRPGDDWILYVPPALGYGEDGAGPIPPNSVLVFRIELLGLLSAR